MPIAPGSIVTSTVVSSSSWTGNIVQDGPPIQTLSRVGAPSILDSATANDLIRAIYMNGTDYLRLVKADGGDGRGIQRSLSLAGGSKGTCHFVLNNRKGFYRPPQGAEVIIEGRNGRFFAGIVDKISEADYTGSAGLIETTVDCIDYGALCERRYIGREYQTQVGNVASILFYQITTEYLADLGITYTFPPYGDIAPPGGLGDMIFNWISVGQAFTQIAQASAGDWRIDFYKNVWPFYPTTGYMDAPFTIRDNDGNWISMKVDRDSSKYANRVGIKNSQNLKPLWTDTFSVTVDQPLIWITMAPLSSAPMVRVDGVPAVVVDYSEIGTRPYDFYWIGTTVIANLAHPPATGSTLEVTYPSPLSYVAWAQDDDQIAAYGLFERVEEVKDISDLDTMQAMAVSVLARRINRPTTLTIITDRDGLEPGMLLDVDTSRPEASGDFLITKVDSQEVGKGRFFRHTVTAADVPSMSLNDLTAFYVNVVSKLAQPRDRVTEHIVFAVAETIEGITNPGLTAGPKQAIRMAPVSGWAKSCSISTNAVTLTTSDVVIDVLDNGVSIFGTQKLVWPAGATGRQTVYTFLADPFEIREGDRFTIDVISADSNFKDGTIDLAMLVA